MRFGPKIITQFDKAISMWVAYYHDDVNRISDMIFGETKQTAIENLQKSLKFGVYYA